MYAFCAELHHGDLGRGKYILPDDTELPDLINGELSDPMSFYCENVTYADERIRGGILEFIAVLCERERKLFLYRISATGFYTRRL